MRPEISTEKASGGEGETEDEKWEAVVEGMQVDERMWEMIMRIAGELMGPWWLLRVIDSESSASSAFPLFLRFCAARDSVWYGVCKMEGLVGSGGHPRPPFYYRLLKAEREGERDGERERGRQAQERDERERERERENDDDKEAEEGRGGCGDGGPSHQYMWLHVYVASRKLGAAIRDVAERVRSNTHRRTVPNLLLIQVPNLLVIMHRCVCSEGLPCSSTLAYPSTCCVRQIASFRLISSARTHAHKRTHSSLTLSFSLSLSLSLSLTHPPTHPHPPTMLVGVYEEALGLEIPYDMRLLYARIDGQEATAGTAICVFSMRT